MFQLFTRHHPLVQLSPLATVKLFLSNVSNREIPRSDIPYVAEMTIV